MNTPERLIRAARHYERAAQIMVKLTIDNVQKYMPPVQSNETIYNRPGIGEIAGTTESHAIYEEVFVCNYRCLD